MLKCGQRELDLVKRYATHDYDSVLDMYYAKARFYDAGDRRFVAMDALKGQVTEPLSLNAYIYVTNNPIINIDLLGLEKATVNIINSALTMEVDTEDISSVVEMINLFSFAKQKSKTWGLKDTVKGYDYLQKKMTDIDFTPGMSVEDILNKLSIYESSGSNRHNTADTYYYKLVCSYLIKMPELGSERYLDMISTMVVNGIVAGSQEHSSYRYQIALNRMMRDANEKIGFDKILFDYSKSFATDFTKYVILYGDVNQEVNYFRNKLNRVPETRDEADRLVELGEWGVVDPRFSVLHQIPNPNNPNAS